MLETFGTSPVEEAHQDELTGRLEATLVKEAELLRELRAIFRKQREALVRGDAERLDDGVFAATRLMRTLDEARASRRKVTRSLIGSELDFLELDAALMDADNRGLRSAREDVLEAARELLREVSVLRGSLHVLLDDNRRCLDMLLGDGQSPSGAWTAQPDGGVAGPGSGAVRAVVDRRV